MGERIVTLRYLDGEEELLALAPGAPDYLLAFDGKAVRRLPIKWEEDAPTLGLVRVPHDRRSSPESVAWR